MQRKGFTLIELLVVISIIALLIAILLPALGQARATARSIACGSNLRQVGVLVHMYTDDYNGKFPRPWQGSRNWMYDLTQTYLHDGHYESNQSSYENDRTGIARCPVRRLSNSEYEDLYAGPNPNHPERWVMYGMNYVFLGETDPSSHWAPNRYTDEIDGVRRPSQTVFAADSMAETGQGHIINAEWSSAYPSPRHPNESANTLWVDGHVTQDGLDTMIGLTNRMEKWMADQ